MHAKVPKTVQPVFTALVLLLHTAQAYGWHDQTHLAIARAAGFNRWYSAAAPDVVKSREAFRPIEEKNHYFNNNADLPVSEEMVMEQVARFNDPDDREGHLYGAIIGSLHDYRELKAVGKYADYPLVFIAHYAGDLSMPLHNTVYDSFNRERHSKNDGIIEGEALRCVGYIRERLYPITIENDGDLAREIARIADISRKLGKRMRIENRDMTRDETLKQAIHSASLFRAILVYAGKNPGEKHRETSNMKQ
jgi:hypothetical protein